MEAFNQEEIKKLYIPSSSSHKGQNGKLMIIGGSHLFHAASLWALEVASKIVDMVFYSSVPENEKIVQDVKAVFRNGMVVPREKIKEYIAEANAVLIGPGMVRTAHDMKKMTNTYHALSEIDVIADEGEQTYALTKYLLQKYPEKKWIIDAGALQMIDLADVSQLKNCILTPHLQEFTRVFGLSPLPEHVTAMAEKYHCVIVLKGEQDIVCSDTAGVTIPGGNAGMTKGGTGDILAGLIAALACNNELFLAAKAGSFFNKKAGESLFARVGYYYNATDLLNEIPHVMKKYILD
ncbi:MAG TPA: NAD(P)H-hydrate dehydratase [Candidatus Saccharimonadales bacterium]|nr:NAD(P)H-hydrate dehydratase [Candidatus Saccharimonadales bacterium]